MAEELLGIAKELEEETEDEELRVSFEDAMSIIKKDAGTHFDPVVAQVFINAEERVRKVTEETH